MLNIKSISLFIAGTMMAYAPSFAANIAPQKLRAEHLDNPAALDCKAPRLSWVNIPASADVKNASQSAYRIVASSSAEKLKKGQYDLWDSGKVDSSDSYLVSYKGSALEDGDDCFWKVMVWDNDGAPSSWSADAKWGRGLTDADSWKAKWIGAPWQGEKHKKDIDTKKERREYPAPLFRKELNVRKDLAKAKAYVTGLGYFELFVNGKKVGDDLLVPNFTNYTDRYDLDKYGIVIDDSFTDYRVMYLAYDITDMLHKGQNAVGAILGNGFFDCTTGWVCPFGSPRLLCQIELTYSDGSKSIVTTDETWKVSTGGIVSDGPFDGEVFDARCVQDGWAEAGFDDSSWQPAVYRKAPKGKLTAHDAPTDKVMGQFKPVSVQKNADGSFDVRYPAEISGWIRINDLEMNAGDTINIKYHCDMPLGVHKYIAASDGKQNYAPRFTWYVFSHATIYGAKDIKPDNVIAEAVNTNVPFAAEFTASNTMLDSINTIWARSQMDNMHGGVASDCPHRERAPYTGDGQVAINTVMSNFDAASFYRKWIRDMRDAQNVKTGYVPNGAPWQPGCGGGVAWGVAMNIMPWEYYKQYGDEAVLLENYPAMKAQAAYMLGWLTPDGTMLAQRGNDNDPNHTPSYWLNLGDWCAPFELPSQELVHTFYLWRALDYTARAARALGYDADEKFYQTKADEVADAFHKKFYDPQAESYGDFGSNVFALEIGVPAEYKSKVVETLRKEISDKYDGHLNTGIFGTRYLFEQLGKNGLNDVAYTAMTRRGYPGFGHWLDQGATVTWEKWNGLDSHNHPMFGGGLTWFYNTLAGVQPDESQPGFKHFYVRPQLASGLEGVSYSYDSPWGKIVSKVSQGDGVINLEVTVPVGATAQVLVPLPQKEMKVTLDGKEAQGKYTTEGFETIVGQGTWMFQAMKQK